MKTWSMFRYYRFFKIPQLAKGEDRILATTNIFCCIEFILLDFLSIYIFFSLKLKKKICCLHNTAQAENFIFNTKRFTFF